ncbi:DUF917 domain-containing protein [Sphingomonas colocasiae]|uniref:DUF917 domain-containing protein n=1 Tax=Sphingomonas colocasiae TaxID=1848973 RepID=A0ABS7PYC5_9SPHN|nr:DUF917 domain-containing protein [Sphingomonas colocasiae]MBY8826361.1 DUF917 domain-containing protein [Sphingomonas colocasiae]
MELNREDLIDYATGATFLGTGGGGDPYIGRLMLQQEFDEGRRADIIDPMDLPDDALVITAAGIGAPTVMIEKIPCMIAAEQAVRAVEDRLGRKADAIISIEAGGANGTLPLVVAARMGLPVVDADGMGRAFPELHMVTFSVYGCKSAPLSLASERGDLMSIETESNVLAERLARSAVINLGAMAQIALYPMSGADVKRTAVPNTLTLSLRIGQTISAARASKQCPFTALIDFFAQANPPRHARILYDGKVSDVLRETQGGFARGAVTLVPIEGDDEPCRITFQNEFLTAEKAGRTLTMVPDLITILDRETGEPITTEALRFGQRVKVMAVGVPPIMRTPEALATFGPRAFGFDMDFVAVEDLPLDGLAPAAARSPAHAD